MENVQEWGMALSVAAEDIMGRVNFKSLLVGGKKRLKQKPKNYLKKKRAKRRMCKSRHK